MISIEVLAPGFGDAVADAQQVFTAVMQGLARPGRPRAVAGGVTPPAPLTPVAGAIALTLADEDTPVWLDDALVRPQVVEWLAFHCGAPVTADPARAVFAFVLKAQQMPPLVEFNQGSDTYPDRSTTVVVCVDGFDDGPAVTLTGPGIERETRLQVTLLDPDFWPQMSRNRQRFPRGVDVVFAGPDGVVGMPRSTSIRATEE